MSAPHMNPDPQSSSANPERPTTIRAWEIRSSSSGAYVQTIYGAFSEYHAAHAHYGGLGPSEVLILSAVAEGTYKAVIGKRRPFGTTWALHGLLVRELPAAPAPQLGQVWRNARVSPGYPDDLYPNEVMLPSLDTYRPDELQPFTPAHSHLEHWTTPRELLTCGYVRVHALPAPGQAHG